MKARALVRLLRNAGAVDRGGRGDHHVLRFPDGHVVVVSTGGRRSETKPEHVKDALRAIEAHGIRRRP